MFENDLPLQSLNELQKRLTDIHVDIPKNTLRRWVKSELISLSNPRCLEGAVGVWALHKGSGDDWSRKVMTDYTVKDVRKFAKKMYTHPNVLLSIPDDTKDDCDPPIEDISFLPRVDCPAKIEPFIIPYVIATLKASRGRFLDEPALIVFQWGKLRLYPNGIYKRFLYGISVQEAPHAKNELRFIIDGQDVRESLLESRAAMRVARASDPENFEKQGLHITTAIGTSLAPEPIDIRDEDDTVDKIYDSYSVKSPPKTKDNKLQSDKRLKRKWKFSEPPTISESEFYVRRAFAAHKENGKPFKIEKGKYATKRKGKTKLTNKKAEAAQKEIPIDVISINVLTKP
ncbi:MAG: hypothetical protein ACXV5H_04790 [Halobacteriota archaeon]